MEVWNLSFVKELLKREHQWKSKISDPVELNFASSSKATYDVTNNN
jgi:hypothetical protein